MMALALLAMVGCGNNTSTSVVSSENGSNIHTHTYDTSKWEYNDTHHWHPTTCGDDEALIKDEHVFFEKDGNNVCAVCGYTRLSIMNDYFQVWKDSVEATLNYKGDYSAECTEIYKTTQDTDVSKSTLHVKETISTRGLYASFINVKDEDEENSHISSVRKYNDTNQIYSAYDSDGNVSNDYYSIICDETYANDYIREDDMYLPLTIYGINEFMLDAEDFTQCSDICLGSYMYYYLLNNGPTITGHSVTISEKDGAIALTSAYSYIYYPKSKTTIEEATDKESVTVKDGKIIEQDCIIKRCSNTDDKITNSDGSYKITYNYTFDNSLANECNSKVVDKITDKSSIVQMKMYYPNLSYFYENGDSYNEPAPETTYGCYELYLDKDLTNKYNGEPLTKSINTFYLKAVPTENMVVFSIQETRKFCYPDFIPDFLRDKE